MLTANFFTDRTMSSSLLKYEASRVVSEDPTLFNCIKIWFPADCPL